MCLKSETESLWTFREKPMCHEFLCNWRKGNSAPSFLLSLPHQTGRASKLQLPLNKATKPRAAFCPELERICSLNYLVVILIWAILWRPQSTQKFRARAFLTKSTQAGSKPSCQATLLSFLVTQEEGERKCNDNQKKKKKATLIKQ